MKKKLELLFKVLVAFVFVAHVSSCKKFDKKTQFDFDIEDNFTIPSNIGVSTPFVNIPTPPVNTNIDQELDTRGRKKEKIESIILTTLQLYIANPPSNTFRFLNDVDVYISAEGLSKVLVASKHDIPSSVGRTLDLDVSSVELEEYIKKDKVNLSVEITTDETILQDVDVNVKATFFVDVKVLGI